MILLNPDPIEGGNNIAVVPPVESTPDLSKSADGLVSKHGDSTAALKVVIGENYEYRTRLREMKAQLPKDGGLVLSADDAKAFSAFRALGTPDELKTALEAGKTASDQVTRFAREKTHNHAASLTGFKPSVLAALAEKDKAEIVVIPGKDKAGKDIEVAHVKGEGDKTTPLAEYAESKWKDFLPALKVVAATSLPMSTPFNPTQTPPRPPIATEPQKRRVNSL